MTTQHEPLVWGPAVEGERTSSGREVTMPGWVWTCTCGQSGFGYKDEKDAEVWCDAHIERDGIGGMMDEADRARIKGDVVIDLADFFEALNDDPDATFGEYARVTDDPTAGTLTVLHQTEDWGVHITVEPEGEISD